MSGGLLEKAKQASGDSDEDVGAAADDAVIDQNTRPKPFTKFGVMLMQQQERSVLACMGFVVTSFWLCFSIFRCAHFPWMVIGSAMLVASGCMTSKHVKSQ